ncbi:MAG: hypothetical protein FWC09_01910 [Lachnospiraceae bacterium]|nr:hypothetical protein [Lachnospiraceae bacterium]
MSKLITWQSVINEQNYEFSYQKVKGKNILTVNGTPNTIKVGFLSSLLGLDEKFDFDGKEARIVMVKGQPDIVINDTYLKSGKPYIARPAWAIVFAILCFAIPVVSLGGAIPIVLGFAGAALCVTVSKSSLSMAVRLILCILITVVAWVLWFALIVGMSMLI